jgi:cytoskeletal protein CcmA (bactofilin family)
MFRKWHYGIMLALLLATFAWPVMAAQGGSGVHFGPLLIDKGERESGDLVNFGPVEIREDAEFDGDLVVFGAVELEEGARITGDLTAFGAADVAGTVEGNLFAAGAAELQESALIEGDVSAVGGVSQAEGAVVEGSVETVEEGDFEWDIPAPMPVPFIFEGPHRMARPGLAFLGEIFRGLLAVVVLGIFALLIASVWPQNMERVGRTMVEEPLPSFGVGVLALLAALIAALILIITVCLSPLALAVAGLAVALGWVALGSVLGEQILRSLFNRTHVTPVAAAVVGTVTITLLAVLINALSDCLYVLLVFPFFVLGAGAVTLTRFGTMPYATRGGTHRPTVAPIPPGTTPPRTPADLDVRPTPPPPPVSPPPPTPEEEIILEELEDEPEAAEEDSPLPNEDVDET